MPRSVLCTASSRTICHKLTTHKIGEMIAAANRQMLGLRAYLLSSVAWYRARRLPPLCPGKGRQRSVLPPSSVVASTAAFG